jgi:hypothetical protein
MCLWRQMRAQPRPEARPGSAHEPCLHSLVSYFQAIFRLAESHVFAQTQTQLPLMPLMPNHTALMVCSI